MIAHIYNLLLDVPVYLPFHDISAGGTSYGALLLGLLQGITEFLPVSSSGHLALAKGIAGIEDAPLSYDIILHVSTLFAVIIYFFKDIMSYLFEWCYGFVNVNARRWAGWRFGWAVIVATLITCPFGVLLKPLMESASSNFLWLGVNFTVTGILLLSSRFIPVGDVPVSVRTGFLVGLIQGIAIFPGISRSGSTIWGGLAGGLSRNDAFKFSFILSVPAIIGAVVLESRELGMSEFTASLPEGWILGAITAFASGLVSLIALRKLVTGDSWWSFSLYCFAVGGFSVIYFLIGA